MLQMAQHDLGKGNLMVHNRIEGHSLNSYPNDMNLTEALKGMQKAGAKRLLFLINHPNQGYSPYELFRHTGVDSGDCEPFFQDLPIYDRTYILEMKRELKRLKGLESQRPLTDQERFDRDFLVKELQNANGRKNGKVFTAKREFRIRAFRKPEDNRGYAALKMSMMRLFPEGSQAKELLKQNLVFRNGKFSWGEVMK